jgi:hypothetical protein
MAGHHTIMTYQFMHAAWEVLKWVAIAVVVYSVGGALLGKLTGRRTKRQS